ncbi:MAG: PTS sugar transporter subunit IIA [Candidatus Wallbacteria bacterium]|nr:PTS sugar transporter subunit IIA [Candidatus Wallbacteria bacterium]
MSCNWLNDDTVKLELSSTKKDEILKELIALTVKSGEITNQEEFTRAIFDREAKITTGIGSGIAIPHARSNAVDEFVMAFARSRKGLDFKSLDDRPVHLFFILGAPLEHDEEYLETMAKLSKLLKEANFRKKILDAKTKEEIIRIISGDKE